jgi:hypothetical protein
LACHAIELLLKAFLSIKGSSLIKLSESKFGHNIDAILEEAEAQGLSELVKLSCDQKTEIRSASYYYSGKVFEYPAMGEAIAAYPRLPNLELLYEAANILVRYLDIPCKET